MPKHLEIFIDTFQWYFLYRVEYQNSILQEFQPERHKIDYFDWNPEVPFELGGSVIRGNFDIYIYYAMTSSMA